MYNQRPNLILGFHGCDQSVRDQLLLDPNKYKTSKEDYDWLGHGIYFWENNYERALEWANDKKKRGTITNPAVVGAVIQLGNCCDLTDRNSIEVVKSYYQNLKEDFADIGIPLPVNKDIKADKHKDMLLRELDCTVLEYMHSRILDGYKADLSAKGYSEFAIYDSTRGIFTEGGPAFDGSGIFDKSHIQICIRNSNCIKGFFMPRKEIKWPV
ncbi:hypothetical protein [Pedobacter jamesrossensis]|uniref:DUF3990 domain-containing protein n=1 Tax=Pedobacter jamesrossensis TaxID=1908238 RepID=A0ABV8NNR5_9SPHI